MPIYEFQCTDCGEKKEILFRKNDEKIEMKCDKCGSANLQRILSSANFAVPGGPAASAPGATSSTHSCSGGSCTTYDIPGPK